MTQQIDLAETKKTRARYDRLARVYDLIEVGAEKRFAPWRQQLWAQVPPGRVLEVGVGTGKNFPYHPDHVEVVGIDLSPRMLERAKQRARHTGRISELHLMDVQQLAFPSGSFDAAVATFVFCSVPNPVLGLRELGRVVRTGGRILLLEHVRIDQPAWVGRLMDVLDPFVVRVMGAHINRRTEENVKKAGLGIENVTPLGPMGVVRLIVARPGESS